MEGRAIARPNAAAVASPEVDRDAALQWRAEQLPGQTMFRGRCGAAVASLQWRAEQLPGQTRHDNEVRTRCLACSLQWRAEQLPGQTLVVEPERIALIVALQWRAEQLPGQTSVM